MRPASPPEKASTASMKGLGLSTWVIILITGLVVALSVISFFVTSSILKRNTISQIDNQLLLAAELARATLPENYHDLIVNENSVSPERYEGIVKNYDKLCLEHNLEYIWSLMEIDDVIRFSSGTSQNKVEHRDHARFFERHTNPQAFVKAFSTMSVQHTDTVDKWGMLRSVLVPCLDSHNRKYLWGASVRLDAVNALMAQHLLTSLTLAGIVGVFGITAGLFFTQRIRKSVNRLSDGVMKVADGDYEHNISVTGIREMRVLAACFNTMSQALSRQVKTLENSERKQRELNDNLPPKIFHKNADLEYVSCNRNYARDMGIEPEAIAGKTDFDFYPRELAEKYRADDRRIMKSGETVEFEETYTKDGKQFVVNTVKRPLKNDNGEVTGILAIFWDITESKKAKEIHEQFIANLEEVDRVIRRSNSLDDMLKSVLTVVRKILDCDRAWLLYPCDPEVETFHVPIESTKPEYAGAATTKSEIAITPEIRRDVIDALTADMPLPGGPGNPRPLSMEIPNPFGIQSQMLMAIHPRTGSPWVFGVHQCSCPRVWSEQEQKLLNEIGHRLADGLSSMLLFEEQRKNEERFRTLVANIPGVTYHCACDENWTMDFISDEIENLTGYPVEDFLHNKVRSYASIIHPEDVKLVDDIVKREVDRKAAYTLEYRVIHSSGKTRWVLERGRGIFDKDDQLLYLDGVIVDITEQKRAERALQESEAKFRSIFEQNIQLAGLLDLEGTVTEINQTALDAAGITRADVIGMPFWETGWWNHSDEQQRNVRNAISKALSGELIRFEAIHIDPAGKPFYADVSIKPVLDENDTMLMLLAEGRDITERKKAEEELSRLRNYLANIIDSMPSVLVGVDVHGKITQWNKTAEAATGIEASTAYGKTLADVFPQMASEMHAIARSIRTKTPKQQKKQLRSVDGVNHYEDITIYPLITNGIEGAVVRIDDVTDQVRLEEMIIQSEKMLSVGGLAAGMAHEINNPLAGIMQTANVMEKRLTGKDISANLQTAADLDTTMDTIQAFMEKRGILEMLTGINESGKRVAGIVNNMLSFARQSDSLTVSYNLRQLIDQALELAATDYDLKKRYDFKLIKIIKTYDEAMPEVLCEVSKIQQVLLNLLRNSAQAMLEAKTVKPQITLSTRYEKENDVAHIEITDNGPGMNEETSKRLFEPFYTTKPVGLGTGLGLSVSYFIITEHHGGEMYAESTLGKGTTMTIRLPIKGKGPRE